MAWQIETGRRNALNAIRIQLSNLSNTLNTYNEGLFKQSELVLLSLSERIEANDADLSRLAALRPLIDRQMRAMPAVDRISILDAQGVNRYSTRERLIGLDSSKRGFFMHHRDQVDRDVFVGQAILSPVDDRWGITVSRRFDDAQGRFAGVVVLVIDVMDFLQVYADIQVGKSGVISLTSSEGHLLVRYPFRPDEVGSDVSRTPIFAMPLREATAGTVDFRSSDDRVEGVHAFTRSRIYPLVTTVTVGYDEVMQGWRSQSRYSLLVVLALLALLILMGRRLMGHIRSRIHAEQALRESQARLLELNRTLEYIAGEDTLTGLDNRRRFDRNLDQQIECAHREQQPLSLVILDVDFFKGFNDLYGHLAGDECLKILARTIRRCVHGHADRVARYGGEEIALTLPGRDASAALVLAEQIAAQIRGLGLPHQGSPFGVVTVSLGVASLQPGGHARRLIDEADRALYAAKAAGRDQALAVDAVQA
ncbi:sensor domain-containing diguanylate cyclase [Pseudomonas sp. DTU_2021_1001937_2_SI_NGA_ILE_001]|uniref:GGDEF domain-containing protein n=1 Tax=Pseudomonas sp. DTU_2021_1001937_2_SI_NGA_ILE_001 TaxID=3077589 RepID=UPI0028FC2758|nr:sensor domain-containing diguanylate cyclase [Pseudomonas sp. DTU_2021_1001937_2_SI_NGA_ILE_001]WNW10033.1 sensor domain-containing diguanylate cyclase [Pseudomonas sp. DTU_2021_1001937_2_SI_NGA_ILE_001]